MTAPATTTAPAIEHPDPIVRLVHTLADRAEARTAEEYDALPEDVKRALSSHAPRPEIQVLELNPEALES